MPVGVSVVVPTHAVMWSENNYDRPREFIPERCGLYFCSRVHNLRSLHFAHSLAALVKQSKETATQIANSTFAEISLEQEAFRTLNLEHLEICRFYPKPAHTRN